MAESFFVTSSTNFPVCNSYQDTNAGNYDFYIAKFNLDLTLVETPTNESSLYLLPIIVPCVFILGLFYLYKKRKN